MKKTLLILCLLSTCFVQSQLFTFRNINHRNGLLLTSVLSIAQDKHGYIWIGTDGAGMQSYDGKTLKNSTGSNIENEHHVSYIDADHEEIYFSSLYKGFYSYSGTEYKKIIRDHKDFGECYGIKKKNSFFCLIGSNKIKLLEQGKITYEYIFKHSITDVIQILELNTGILLLTNEHTYFINKEKVVELNSWLGLKHKLKASAARFYEGKLQLYDFSAGKMNEISLDLQDRMRANKQISIAYNKAIKVYRAYSKADKIILCDAENNLYYLKNKEFKYLPKNKIEDKFDFSALFIDSNKDYWAATNNEGIYKISDEPFTKVELNGVFQQSLISFIFKNRENDIVLSTYENKTFIGSFRSSVFEESDIRIYGHATYQKRDLFATNKGVYYLSAGKLLPYPGIKSKDPFNFIFSDGALLYFAQPGAGLSVFDPATKKTTPIFIAKPVSHIYAAEMNQAHTKIYFGTNDGLFEYACSSKKMTKLGGKFTGSYCGVSCKDSHGTIWFSMDKELIGITKREEYLVINNPNYFNSTLFYNLCSDRFGNLIIGTNLGITRLKVNENGHVLKVNHYNNKNGFDGYETHMRSKFQNENTIYIGTIEGLFSINAEKLERLPSPPKPLIFQLKEKNADLFNSDEELVKVNYLAINPKLKGILYTYRLKGKSKVWSDLTNKTEAYFSSLSDQEYVFEVKSTYDGLVFSPIASYKIVKDTPFWKSKWFILALILSIALANIIVLDRSKSFELSHLIENQSIEINSRIRSIILLFGFISNSGVNYLAGLMESDLPNLNQINIICNGILLVLFLISISKVHIYNLSKYLLQIGLYVIIIQCYLSAYLSNIHPLFVVIIALSTSLTPFVLNRIKEIIIFSVFHIVSATAIVFLLDYTNYNEILFMIMVIVSVCLSIFTTYIRYESLQKLLFISGIINKGNVLAIAFNQEHKITYVSENSFKALEINPQYFLGKDISELNKFIHKSYAKREIDFTREFQSEQQLIIPMQRRDGTEISMEWTLKVLSKTSKLIFGQDVSGRMAVENKYDALVTHIQDFIYYGDVKGNIIYTNAKLQEYLGYDEEELKHRNSLFLVAESHLKMVKSFYENQFKNKIVSTYLEFPMRKNDGSEIWIGQHTSLMFGFESTKYIKGFLSIARDISDKRKQQKLILDQNEHISASISAAIRIQQNLLPSNEMMRAVFREVATFYQAKNSVGGDFYWMFEINQKLIFVIGDCTGHGVPGSFMTLLAINQLREIVCKNLIDDPAEILTKMDENLQEILGKELEKQVQDSMEMTVLQIDRTAGVINFACAGGMFISIQQDELIIHRGESKHIAEPAESNFTNYHSYRLDLENIQKLFLFTDGIQEQFSESEDKKFTIKRLMELIKKHKDEPVSKVIQEIKVKIDIWKGTEEQTDDITLIGLKL